MRFLTVSRSDGFFTLQHNSNIETMEDFIIKRDAWHDTIAQMGTPLPQKLPDNFNGQGIKEGYRYYKFLSVGKFYFYQVRVLGHSQNTKIFAFTFDRRIGFAKDQVSMFYLIQSFL